MAMEGAEPYLPAATTPESSCSLDDLQLARDLNCCLCYHVVHEMDHARGSTGGRWQGGAAAVHFEGC